jgi:hypothetical protein
MEALCSCRKLSIHRNQTIEVWSNLSPRPITAISEEELPRHEYTDEEKSDRDSEYTGVDPIEGHPGKGDA